MIPIPKTITRRLKRLLAGMFCAGVVCLASASSFAAGSLQGELRFGNLGIKDGLSQSSLYCGYQDERGFLWFGTEDGLNRYDGYEFTVYQYDPTDDNSLGYNWISAICDDSSGNLWVGTFAQGLNRLDPTTGNITRFRADPDDPTALVTNDILALHRGDAGTIWVGNSGGLTRIDTEELRFTNHLWLVPEHGTGQVDIMAIASAGEGRLWLGSTTRGLGLFQIKDGACEWFPLPAGLTDGPDGRPLINCLLSGAKGGIWLGTDHGVWAFDRYTGTFFGGLIDELGERSFTDGSITAMVEDLNGNRWLGTDHGLVRYDGETGRHQLFKVRRDAAYDLRDNAILSLTLDRSHVLWVGTGLGLSYLDLEYKKFEGHEPDDRDPNSLSNVFVRSFKEDADGSVWIATWGGLNRWERWSNRFRVFPVNPERAAEEGPDRVYGVDRDDSGRLVVGTEEGAFRFKSDGPGFERLGWDPQRKKNTIANPVRVVHRDRAGDLWLGTGDGLYQLPAGSDSVKSFRHDPDQDSAGPCDNYIYALSEDRRGNLWVGTSNGLSRLDPDRHTFRNYYPRPGYNTGLNTYEAMAIAEGKDGAIWIGTPAGLNRLDPDTETFTYLTMHDGLPNNSIYTITPDAEGRFWLTTNNGIACLDPVTRAVMAYDHSDGLLTDEFNLGAALTLSTGEIAVGGIGGFNVFDPSLIEKNQIPPQLAFTDFKVFNNSLMVDGEYPLFAAKDGVPEVVVSHRDYVFEFEFSAMHYAAPSENRYATMLEGVDTDWIDIGTRRYVTYNNLPPGRYVFRVKAANGDGVWSPDEISAVLHITPPFWRKAWFRVLGLILMGLTIWAFYQYRMRLMHFKARELEKNVESRTLELQQEISERVNVEHALAKAHRQAVHATEAKSTFLATMSHEIRTPMNGVIGMAQLLLESPDLSHEDRDQVATIQSSGESLLTIINDILDFSKIEAGKMEFEATAFDLHRACLEVAELLAPKASGKGLELVCRIAPGAPQHLVGDVGRIRQIILNLVGNAIKFSATGYVLIEIEGQEEASANDRLRISIRDTGIGMSQDACTRLFQPFSQADSSTTRRFGGTGLGLAICKQLVDLMGGEIGVESTEGEGSAFWFALSLPAADVSEPQVAPKFAPGTRVLLVDEVAVQTEVHAELLATWGLETGVAHDETAALAKLESAAAAGAPFAAVVCSERYKADLGQQLAQHMQERAQLATTPLLLLAPASLPQDEVALQAVGFAGMLVKPARPGILGMALELMCEEQSTAASNDKSFINRRFLSGQRAAQDGASGEKIPRKTTETRQRNLRVLVAEDNMVNQRVAKRMLEKAGCTIDLAANGEEAVEMWSKLPYDIVFMDCRMPEMDGYMATKEIRAREADGRHTPIVAMTANVMDGDRERCLDAGMDDYLPKPLKMEACHKALDQWADPAPDPTAADVPEPVGA